VFDAAGAPANLPVGGLNDLELLPDRASQAERKKLIEEVGKWRASAPGAPPRAMVLEDAPTLYEPHVFLRAPEQPGAAGAPPVPQGAGRR